MKTILIADDDPGIVLLMTAVLQKHGYKIRALGDGTKVQECLEREGPEFQAVLLDWEMPGMSGIELLRWMKEHPKLEQIPVIMETARTEPEHIREGVEAGAYYYLTKPLDQKLLLSIVSAAVADYEFKRSLLDRLRQSENPFAMLVDGTFRFRTIPEAERLALWIANSCPQPDNAMEVSEILINAIEHGIVGITYDEKGEFIDKGTWNQEVERRLALPEHAAKYATARITREADKLTAFIEDQGPGFDYARFLVMDESRAFDNHGRGIAMANSCLQLEYLGKGNKVLVTIPFD